MIEYLINHMWQSWAIVAVICLILELSSGDLFIVCISLGALCAAIAAALGVSIYWQLAILAVCSTVAIFTIRPVALRWLHKDEPQLQSNADALVDSIGRVTEDIPAEGTGYVQIYGDQWRAVSADGCAIVIGTKVRVTHRESTVLTVEALKD